MTHPKASLVFLAAFTAIAASGCKQREPEERQRAAQPASPTASSLAPEITIPQPREPGKSSAPEPLKVGLTWKDPAGWTRMPRTSPMRAATYKVPRAAGDTDDGEMAVFYFGPGQGGDIDGNVQRWAMQFGKTLADVKRTNREVHGIQQHLAEIDKGDFSSDMMGRGGAGKKDWAMLAAIVEAPSGSYFFKLTGPQRSVAAQRDAFFALLDSVETKD
jgi:hypothetical protein